MSAARALVWFWAISAALLLWGLGGASIYVAYFVETPEQFAQGAESAAHEQAYAEYVSDIPPWAIGLGIGAAAARLLGAVALLLRRAWALPLYVTSLLLFAGVLFRAFVLADAATAMSAPHIATEGVFLFLSLFAVWFAYANRANGILK
jgi:hypothetical protein